MAEEQEKYISLSQTGTLKFQKESGQDMPRATLDIQNIDSEQNIAYKIKTTAPKLFVVKPIQGIITPGRNIQIEIQLQMKELQNLQEIFKNKFMIQATPVELQTSEAYKLAKFWEQKVASKDKTNLQ